MTSEGFLKGICFAWQHTRAKTNAIADDDSSGSVVLAVLDRAVSDAVGKVLVAAEALCVRRATAEVAGLVEHVVDADHLCWGKRSDLEASHSVSKKEQQIGIAVLTPHWGKPEGRGAWAAAAATKMPTMARAELKMVFILTDW